MTDESKVKTTFIRPVNRTMSYEDRRGYVCICMYDIGLGPTAVGPTLRSTMA